MKNVTIYFHHVALFNRVAKIFEEQEGLSL